MGIVLVNLCEVFALYYLMILIELAISIFYIGIYAIKYIKFKLAAHLINDLKNQLWQYYYSFLHGLEYNH